jgi:hypothetical protein
LCSKTGRSDREKASDGGVNETKEHWVYDMTIENETFKELINLDLKYVIFFKQVQLGVKAGATPRQQRAASASIPSSRAKRNHLAPIRSS